MITLINDWKDAPKEQTLELTRAKIKEIADTLTLLSEVPHRTSNWTQVEVAVRIINRLVVATNQATFEL